MYERLLDKNSMPTTQYIEEYLGDKSFLLLSTLEEYLQAHYQLSKELRFPFGSSYGWGYKYSHKSAHLCYSFFEKGAFTVTIQIGDKQAHLVDTFRDELSHKARELWADRYPCGEYGGWIHYRVTDDSELKDIITFIGIKKKPL